MGQKNELNNAYQKAVKAGEFEGTFEQYLYSQGITGFSEGQAMRGDTAVSQLGGSYQNWTEVARAEFAGQGLSEHELTVLALQMQDMNPGVNTWSPGQTINLPDISAAEGTISDERWARLKEEETGGGYFDYESWAPTNKYWAEQQYTSRGYEREKATGMMGSAPAGAAETEPLTGPEGAARKEQVWSQRGMSNAALAWHNFFAGYFAVPELTGAATVEEALPDMSLPIPQTSDYFGDAILQTLYGQGFTLPTMGAEGATDMPDLSTIDPSDREAMLSVAPEGWQVIETADGSGYVFMPPEGVPVTLGQLQRSDYDPTATQVDYTAQYGSVVDALNDNNPAAVLQFARDNPKKAILDFIDAMPEVAAALDADVTSFLTDQQLATLIQLGVWKPTDISTLGDYPSIPPADSKYSYYGGDYMTPGGYRKTQLPMSRNDLDKYILPTGYAGRALYQGLINHRNYYQAPYPPVYVPPVIPEPEEEPPEEF